MCEGATTHYHATYVRPAWAKTKTKTTRIDRHIFYRWESKMTELFLGFAALVFVEQNKDSLLDQLGRIKNPDIVWEIDPIFISKNALAIAV